MLLRTLSITAIIMLAGTTSSFAEDTPLGVKPDLFKPIYELLLKANLPPVEATSRPSYLTIENTQVNTRAKRSDWIAIAFSTLSKKLRRKFQYFWNLTLSLLKASFFLGGRSLSYNPLLGITFRSLSNRLKSVLTAH
jgi:hypothetical protein